MVNIKDFRKIMASIISNNIKAERARSGMSQQEVAEKLNIATRTYIRWEQNPNFDCIDLLFLANLFNCKTDDFYLGIDTTKCGI